MWYIKKQIWKKKSRPCQSRSWFFIYRRLDKTKTEKPEELVPEKEPRESDDEIHDMLNILPLESEAKVNTEED